MRIDEKYIGELDREALVEEQQLASIVEKILKHSDEDDRDNLLVELAEHLRSEYLPEAAARATDRISIDWAPEKAALYSRIASDFYKAGNQSQAYRLLVRALRASKYCDIAWQEAEVRVGISRVLVQMKAPDVARNVLLEAIPIAKRDEHGAGIQDSIDASSVLADVAEALAAMGLAETARKIALGIRSSLKRKRALKNTEPSLQYDERERRSPAKKK